MCGLFAAFSLSGERQMDFSTQLELMTHRGPDDHGALSWSRSRGLSEFEKAQNIPAEAWLGHRRLSIIDLDPRGRQPMLSADNRYALVFNGEIYNYVELREELSRLGARFGTQTDTEVLLQAYLHWGKDALPRLKGMFAFVIVDFETGEAVAARDPFGIKPLYVAKLNEQVLFSSELWPLIGLQDIATDFNASALYQYFRFGTAGAPGTTLFNGIESLPPAHVMTVDFLTGKMTSPQKYWEPKKEPAELSFAEAVSQTRERFLDNIRLHLRSDVPVGAALSGGVDSSAIVCAMRHVAPELKFKTFSYIADDPAYSEERWVDIVCKHADVKSCKIKPAPHDLGNDLEKLIRHQGAPFGSTSIYAQYKVFEAARREGVTVMLDGQGADELLAGYTYFLGSHIASRLRSACIGDVMKLISNAARENQISTASLVQSVAQFLLPASGRAIGRRILGRELMPAALNSNWFHEKSVDVAALARDVEGAPRTLRDHLSQKTFLTSLPHLLRYEDRNSMAFSIESRVPFLTHDFAEFVLNLPPEYLISNTGRRKHVFREAMRGIVPDEILDRRDKIGFRSTEREWLRANIDMVSQISSDAGDYPFLSAARVQDLIAGLRAGEPVNSNLVWRIFNFLVWAKQINTHRASGV